MAGTKVINTLSVVPCLNKLIQFRLNDQMEVKRGESNNLALYLMIPKFKRVLRGRWWKGSL